MRFVLFLGILAVARVPDPVGADARSARLIQSWAVPQPPRVRASRPISLLELFSMRHIGALAISPDGNWVAFTSWQPDTATNGYRIELSVVGTRPGSRPVRLGRIGSPRFNLADTDGPAHARPTWSPDSRFITYVMRPTRGTVAAQPQVFLWAREGGRPQQLTKHPREVLYAVWAPDGRSVLYSVLAPRPDSALIAQRYSARGFWMFDASDYEPPVDPGQSSKVHPIYRRMGSIWSSFTPAGALDNVVNHLVEWWEPGSGREGLSGPYEIWTYDIRQHAERVGSAADDSLYHALISERDRSQSKGGRLRFELRRADGGTPGAPKEYLGRSVMFAFDGVDTLARQVSPGLDSYSGCSFAAERFACIRENPTMPPEVTAFDVDGTDHGILTDLNSGFRAFTFPGAQLVEWTDSLGNLGFGHLYLPDNYVASTKYPTILLPFYASRWEFPWARTNEYPIYLFTARGYAVLTPDIQFYRIRKRRDHAAWFRMGSGNLATVVAAVRKLAALGVTDSTRVGIAGVSYGANTVNYVISHTTMFRAAAAPSADAITVMGYYLLPQAVLEMQDYNMGGTPGGAGLAGYEEWALDLRAARVQTPLLFDAPESEYRQTLSTVIELRALKKPVEMVVFPEATHFKLHPRQILAAWELNLDWFDFWLRDVKDSAPEKVQQYARWERLRREWSDRARASPE
jgi:dipeptidyl aminopeptidase/acylaminoacyl peptidase